MEEKDERFREVAQIFKESLGDFHKAMEYRDNLTVRIGRRTTQIIRYGMFGLLVLALAMFYLIYILTTNMEQITGRMNQMAVYMGNMDKQFTLVANNVQAMNRSVERMNEHIHVMHLMNVAIGNISEQIGQMSIDMHQMNTNMAAMKKSMNRMSADMTNMSYQFTGLNGHVGSMEYNVNRMAAPMKIFPFP